MLNVLLLLYCIANAFAKHGHIRVKLEIINDIYCSIIIRMVFHEPGKTIIKINLEYIEFCKSLVSNNEIGDRLDFFVCCYLKMPDIDYHVCILAS